jgi:hypothetical protein
MFLLRMTFWLAVVIMLVPAGTDPSPVTTSDRQLSVDGAIGAAAATVSDMAGFCGRNREVCETGGAAWSLFVAKAENAARLAYRMAAGTPGAASRDDDRSTASLSSAPGQASGTPGAAGTDTLRESDLEPTWRGPGAEDI